MIIIRSGNRMKNRNRNRNKNRDRNGDRNINRIRVRQRKAEFSNILHHLPIGTFALERTSI